MNSAQPERPIGDTIDITDPKAVRAWAAWLGVGEAALTRIVGIVGPSAGQIEFMLGKSKRSRW